MVAISIAVPVYNVEKYLIKCLNSIFKQSFKDIEVICVDDGSTDKSPLILKEFSKIYENMKIITQENQGLSVARNAAVAEAKGKYTMFIDADDLLTMGTALERLYNYAESHNSDVVIFDFLSGGVDLKNPQRHHFPNVAERYGETSFNAFLAEPFVYRFIPVATWTKLYKTKVIRDIQFVPNLNNQDVVHWAQVYTKATNINYFPIPVYYYTIQREGAITGIKGRKAFDVFKAFGETLKVLKESGYYEKFKNIHYTHFCSNLIHKLKIVEPSIRKELIEKIQEVEIDINWETFKNENFYPFEKEDIKVILFIKEHKFKDIRKFLVSRGIWKK
jgi:glycosyltransferase involved in cell wall biosynthesis